MPRRVLIAAFLAVLAAMPAVAQQKKGAAPEKSTSAAQAASEDPVVARINGVVLHRSDLDASLRSEPPQVQQQIQQEPKEQRYLDVLRATVSATLLSQAGRKAKIDQIPQVKQAINATTEQIISSAYIASLARTEITEAKLREAYDRYAKAAPQTEEVHARHILVATEQEAKDVIAQLNKGADFSALAKEKTIDPPGKTDGGDLDYFTKDEKGLPAEFVAAAFALKPGQFTQTPVHTQFGWHVIKVEDRRPEKVAPYQQVAPEIAAQMEQAIGNQKVQELVSQGKVELFGLDGKPIPIAANGAQSGAPATQAEPAAKQAPAAKPVAPTLALPSGGLPGGSVPGAPTLSPATAPDQLGK